MHGLEKCWLSVVAVVVVFVGGVGVSVGVSVGVGVGVGVCSGGVAAVVDLMLTSRTLRFLSTIW